MSKIAEIYISIAQGFRGTNAAPASFFSPKKNPGIIEALRKAFVSYAIGGGCAPRYRNPSGDVSLGKPKSEP